MRKGTLPIITALLLAAPPLALAQSSVDFSAGYGQRNVQGVNSQPLADNNAVWVGYFDSGFDIAANSGNLTALESSWNLLTKDTIETIFGAQGAFGGQGSTSDPSFNNVQLWFWIFQTSDNSPPDLNFDDVVGYGLYTSTDPSWIMPATDLAFPFNSTAITSDQVNTAYHGSYNSQYLVLQPIPEPSTAGILVFGACLAGYMINRKKRAPTYRCRA